jgi:hypothetical protein
MRVSQMRPLDVVDTDIALQRVETRVASVLARKFYVEKLIFLQVSCFSWKLNNLVFDIQIMQMQISLNQQGSALPGVLMAWTSNSLIAQSILSILFFTDQRETLCRYATGSPLK